MTADLEIRAAVPGDYESLGRLMVEVYARLDGFPTRDEQPGYYDMLAGIGTFNEPPDTQVLVAVSAAGKLAGGVVYIGDMSRYASGGTAPGLRNTSGIRLLAVDAAARGAGVGKALTRACIGLASARGHSQVVLHTTRAMKVAWDLYAGMGFERSPDLDFMQEALEVFGFRLRLPAGSADGESRG